MKTTFRIFLFILILIAIVMINMIVFRSDFPMLWLVTLIPSVFSLILFPYSKFFLIKKKA